MGANSASTKTASFKSGFSPLMPFPGSHHPGVDRPGEVAEPAGRRSQFVLKDIYEEKHIISQGVVPEDFVRRYLFDDQDPCSIRSAVDAILGDGMELRATITSPTLAYPQMAQGAMEMAGHSEAPCVELQ